jgi:hypothetical protein
MSARLSPLPTFSGSFSQHHSRSHTLTSTSFMGLQTFGKNSPSSIDASAPFQQYTGLQATVDIVPTPASDTACDLSVIPQADFLHHLHSVADASSAVRASPVTPQRQVERSATSSMMSAKRDSLVRKFSTRKLNIETSATYRGSDDEGSGGYGSDDGRQSSAPTTNYSGHRLTPVQDASIQRTNINLLHDMDEKRCIDMFHSILTGETTESKQSIGIMFQNLRVEANSLHELYIACSFKHIQQSSHAGPDTAQGATLPLSFLRHSGYTVCSVRISNALMKWRHDIPCLLSDSASTLYAHILVPRHVHTANVEILFHESSLFKRKETMLIVHTHECFFRNIQGANNIEKSWTIPTRGGHPLANKNSFVPSSTSSCFDAPSRLDEHTMDRTVRSTPKWSLLHKITDDIHVIHDPQVSIADSAYLRWELHKNGMLCHFHTKDLAAPSILSYGGDEHINQCNTCFIHKDPWAYEQSNDAVFCHYFDDARTAEQHAFTTAASSSPSSSPAASLQHGKDAIAYIKRRVNSMSSKSHSMAGKLELMKRYIEVLTAVTSRQDSSGLAMCQEDEKILLMTDAVVMRRDIEENLAEHIATLSNKEWDILLLGAYWWENKNNSFTNPLVAELQRRKTSDASVASERVTASAASPAAQNSKTYSSRHFTFHKRNETLPARMTQMTENPEWQLHSLQPIGFSCPYSSFAMILRTRDVQCKVLEFFKTSLAQNVNAFQMFHLWANREFEHKAYVCVPNLFMMHPNYDEVGANLIAAEELTVTTLSSEPPSSQFNKKLAPVHSFKNYSREHIMYWDIERYSWLNESMLRGSIIPSSLSLLPSMLNLPQVHVFIFIDHVLGNTTDVLMQLVMSLTSFSNQSYAHIKITLFFPAFLKTRLCDTIACYSRLQHLCNAGKLDCVAIDANTHHTFQNDVAKHTLCLLQTNYAYNNAFVLVEKIGVLSLPHRTSMLIKHGQCITDTQKHALGHLLATSATDNLQQHSTACVPAQIHRYSTFTLMTYFYHAFLRDGMPTTSLHHQESQMAAASQQQQADDSVAFTTSLDRWMSETAGSCEVIPCILAFVPFMK